MTRSLLFRGRRESSIAATTKANLSPKQPCAIEIAFLTSFLVSGYATRGAVKRFRRSLMRLARRGARTGAGAQYRRAPG